MKKCSKCGIEKEFVDFGRDSRAKSGIRSQCKSCNTFYAKDWANKNPEKYKAKHKEIYEKNKDVYILKAANWAKNNPIKYAAFKKASSIKNKERNLQLVKDWNKKNPNARRLNGHKRRAQLRNNGVYLVTQKELQKLYESPCAYCGSKERITVDHIIPIYKGGTHSIGNLTSACKSCNSSKRINFLTVWKKKLRLIEQLAKEGEINVN
jgi:5-methylcytosine-specific restriction endonuclease McrA